MNPFLQKLWPLPNAMFESMFHINSIYDFHYICVECIMFVTSSKKNHNTSLSNLVLGRLEVLQQFEHLALNFDA